MIEREQLDRHADSAQLLEPLAATTIQIVGCADKARETANAIVRPIRPSRLRRAVLRTVLDMSPAPALPNTNDETALRERLTGLGLRVLLAEDNPVNQKVAVHMLEGLGCRVRTAFNGNEVLRAFKEDQPEVILMDVQMPEMDGYEATAAIRAMADNPIPIIALTANAMPQDRERCLQAGMDDFVTKPIAREELVRVLENWGSQVRSLDAKPV